MPALRNWMPVRRRLAGPTKPGGVGHLGDINLLLSDADRLDQHDVERRSIARLIGQTSALRPPNSPRQASERMNTSRSAPLACIAAGRPAAPTGNGLDGSTARMATFRPRRRHT